MFHFSLPPVNNFGSCPIVNTLHNAPEDTHQLPLPRRGCLGPPDCTPQTTSLFHFNTAHSNSCDEQTHRKTTEHRYCQIQTQTVTWMHGAFFATAEHLDSNGCVLLTARTSDTQLHRHVIPGVCLLSKPAEHRMPVCEV